MSFSGVRWLKSSMTSAKTSETGSMYHVSRMNFLNACARVEAMVSPCYALFSMTGSPAGAAGAVCARVSASTRARARVSRSG